MIFNKNRIVTILTVLGIQMAGGIGFINAACESSSPSMAVQPVSRAWRWRAWPSKTVPIRRGKYGNTGMRSGSRLEYPAK